MIGVQSDRVEIALDDEIIQVGGEPAQAHQGIAERGPGRGGGATASSPDVSTTAIPTPRSAQARSASGTRAAGRLIRAVSTGPSTSARLG